MQQHAHGADDAATELREPDALRGSLGKAKLRALRAFVCMLLGAALIGQADAVPTLSLVASPPKIHAPENLFVDVRISGLQSGGSTTLLGAFDFTVLFDPDVLAFLPSLSHLGTALGDPTDQSQTLAGGGLLGPGALNLFEVSLLEASAETCVFCVGPYLQDLQTSDELTLATLAFFVPGSASDPATTGIGIVDAVLSDAQGVVIPDLQLRGAFVAISEPSALLVVLTGLALLGLSRRNIKGPPVDEPCRVGRGIGGCLHLGALAAIALAVSLHSGRAQAAEANCEPLPVSLVDSGSTFELRSLGFDVASWTVTNALGGFSGRQELSYRIGGPGPERPFSTLDVCLKRSAPNRLDVTFTEVNQVARLPVHSVQAVSICTDPDLGSPSQQYPRGCRDCNGVRCTFPPPAEDGSLWRVRLFAPGTPSAGDAHDIPVHIQGIKVVLRPDPYPITTGAGDVVQASSYIQCGDDCVLYVPAWWLQKQGIVFGELPSCVNIPLGDQRVCRVDDAVDEIGRTFGAVDHAGDPLVQEQLLVASRFSGKLSYVLWGGPESTRFDQRLGIQGNAGLVLEVRQLNSNAALVSVNTSVSTGAYYRPFPQAYGYLTALSGLGQKSPGEANRLDNFQWVWTWRDVLPNGTAQVGTSNNIAASAFFMLGDFNADGCVATSDLALLSNAIRAGKTDSKYDLNGDGAVNIADARRLVLLFTRPGGVGCS